MTMTSLSTVAAALMLIVGPRPASADPSGFTDADALKLGDELSSELGADSNKSRLAHGRFEVWLADRRSTHSADTAITGVFAYQMGEGGFIVKVTKGHGIIRYFRECDRPFHIDGVSGGAQVGGSTQSGVGVILGTGALSDFEGHYSFTQVGATAGDAGANTTELKRKGSTNRVVLFGTSSGLSATTGLGSMKIVLDH